jgi:hypothetical protein
LGDFEDPREKALWRQGYDFYVRNYSRIFKEKENSTVD